jgi:RHS repeat-associated protein
VPAFDLPEEAPQDPATAPGLDTAHDGGIDLVSAVTVDCGCATATPPDEPPADIQDVGFAGTQESSGVYVNTGEFFDRAVDLRIPGRGFDWTFERKYRSGITSDGPLGHNWDFNYDLRLVPVTAANQNSVDPGVVGALSPGDVLRVDGGGGRVDLYRHNPDGTFTAPAGYYTQLTENLDGSFRERDAHGDIATYAAPDAQGVDRLASLADPHGNLMGFTYDAQGRLIGVVDTLGRTITYHYAGSHLDYVQDFANRRISFSYNGNGDLIGVTSPAVTSTPNGNDFPLGKTTAYTYSSGFADSRLNHDLLSIEAPNEVASGGVPRIVVNYETNNASFAYARVKSQTMGGLNASGVPFGATINYAYTQVPPPGDPLAGVAFQTAVTDANGNVTQYQANTLGNIIDIIRSPAGGHYETVYAYNADGRLVQKQMPAGNRVVYTYDSSNSDRYQQGNLLSMQRFADPGRGGDQTSILTTYTYEPVYNQLRTVTDPRGNDGSYVPQNGGSNSAARYTTTYTFDYQEGNNVAGLATIVGVSVPVMTARLAGIPLNLGDINGDGVTDDISGDTVRIVHPTVTLLPGSQEAAVEGTTQQPIVEYAVHNEFGQMIRHVDAEGNVDTYIYYAANDPNGDGIIDNPAGNATTGGYLKQFVHDDVSAAGRDSGANPTPANLRQTFVYDAVGNIVRSVDGRGIATDYVINQLNQVVQMTQAAATDVYGPDPVNEPAPLVNYRYIQQFAYDANGNLVARQTEDRGNTSQVLPPGSLADDVNGDGIVDGSDLATVIAHLGLASGATLTDGDVNGDGAVDSSDLTAVAGAQGTRGPTPFISNTFQYDIMDHRVQMVQPINFAQNLVTRYRYDPNGNLVLTIEPEGNANSIVYDDRDLRSTTTSGALVAPIRAQLSGADPGSFNVRGGLPATTTYHYDINGNLIEVDDASDTDLSAANNSTLGGIGDRTRYIFDGFDRQTSSVDPLGNQTVYQYDPTGSLVRVSHFGPTGGASPTSDGPATLLRPVSSHGVIQNGNLVNAGLLSSTEYRYDELLRQYQTDQLLFVHTISTLRAPDVQDGATSIGKGNLTPGDNALIPGIGQTIIGRVSTRTEFDRDSRPTFNVQDDGDVTRSFYDGAGRLSKTLDPAGNTIEYAYDHDGNLIETRETDVSQIAGIPNEIFLTTNFYDSLNHLQRRVDNVGQTMEYRYDSRGDLVAQSDGRGPVTGATIARRAFTGGALTVNAINDPGNVTLFYYDAQGRLVRQDQVLTASGQGDGLHVGATLEGIKTTTPPSDPSQGGGDGIIRTGYVYDRNSNESAVIDDQGNVTLSLFDDLNRQVAQTQGITVFSTLTKANILGPRNLLTPTPATINNPAIIPQPQIDAQLAEVGASLASIAPQFPALAFSIDDHPPTTIAYGLDPDGNVLILEDQNDNETFTKYDADNRPIDRRIFRFGHADSFVGDTLFAPNPVSDPSNPSTTFPAVGGTTRQDYQYDGVGRLVFAYDNNDPTTINDDSQLTFAHDSLGRPIEELQRIGPVPPQPIDSAWRAENLRSRLIYPNNRAENYTYDNRDRLQTVTDLGALQPIDVYSYIGPTRLLQRISPLGGTRMTYLNDAGTADIGYDGLRRQTEVRTLRTDNSLVVGFAYAYDGANDNVGEAKLHSTLNSESYGYDSAGRLIAFNRVAGGIPAIQSNWQLDGAGNWQQVGTESRLHSSFNEITQRISPGPPITIQSDDNGNEIDDGTLLYTYDAMDRLRTVNRKSDGAPIAVYTYDALGRRTRKVVANSGPLNGTTDFYYDGNNSIEEHNAANVLTQQYVFGGAADEPLVIDRNLNGDATATGAGDQRLFYHQNALGSVAALTLAGGNVVEGYQYDAYGRQTVFAPGPNGIVDFGGDDIVTVGGLSNFANPFLFAGYRADFETGLYDDRHRYLDPILGRFITRDPIGAWGDLLANGNAYAYTGDSPTNWTDPSGLTTTVDIWDRNLLDGRVGHGSMEIGNKKDKDHYVSFWPDEDASWFRFYQAATTSTYSSDMAAEGGKPDHQITIDCLDEEAMVQEWKKIRQEIKDGTLHYSLLSTNCVQIVARVLFAGAKKPECPEDSYRCEFVLDQNGELPVMTVPTQSDLIAAAEALQKNGCYAWKCCPYSPVHEQVTMVNGNLCVFYVYGPAPEHREGETYSK